MVWNSHIYREHRALWCLLFKETTSTSRGGGKKRLLLFFIHICDDLQWSEKAPNFLLQSVVLLFAVSTDLDVTISVQAQCCYINDECLHRQVKISQRLKCLSLAVTPRIGKRGELREIPMEDYSRACGVSKLSCSLVSVNPFMSVWVRPVHVILSTLPSFSPLAMVSCASESLSNTQCKENP